MTRLTTEVLVVGGGTGGTAAAIQAARRGADTVLVSEFPWLGGMLTAAGVAAPDGNELVPFQTGLWGAFLRALVRRQPGGLDHGWVSFFTYEPRVGAAIFAEWVRALPNLHWVVGKQPRAVLRSGDRIQGVQFDDLTVYAHITLEGSELGDLLALGDVPYRWGWEARSVFGEPSAPGSLQDPQDPLAPLLRRYPVQSPTWVVLLQDAGAGQSLPAIAPTADYDASCFAGAWEGYGAARFLTYGQLPGGQLMLNWPQQGNDYGQGLDRLIQGESTWRAWATEAIAHSQNFAHYLQSQLGRRYGLASDAFPRVPGALGGGAWALMPYYRESRRVVGLTTVTEQAILPQPGGRVAALPLNSQGQMSAIAIGNYPNDHHYPGFELPLAAKSLHWGGRWTGTPFTIPYGALVPLTVDGLLVCDKSLSVSHIANGATRLQPVVLGIGQAAGMAAALCVEQGCQPRQLPVAALQQALLADPTAAAAVVPLLNHLPDAPQWRSRQHFYCQSPEHYPADGNDPTMAMTEMTAACPSVYPGSPTLTLRQQLLFTATGENWAARVPVSADQVLQGVTLHPGIHQQIQQLSAATTVCLRGIPNWAAGWIQVTEITSTGPDSE